VGFVTTFFVLTRFLSAEEIGLARVLVDAATLFIGLAQLGTTSSIIRFYPHFKAKDERLKVKVERRIIL
jgi:O-antigen/teichoic acid export membrane protein